MNRKKSPDWPQKRHLTLYTAFTTCLLDERGSWLAEECLPLPTSDRSEQMCILSSSNWYSVTHTHRHSPGQTQDVYSQPHQWPHSLGLINSACILRLNSRLEAESEESRLDGLLQTGVLTWLIKLNRRIHFLNNLVLTTHLTFMYWEQGKAFRMTNNKFRPFHTICNVVESINNIGQMYHVAND